MFASPIPSSCGLIDPIHLWSWVVSYPSPLIDDVVEECIIVHGHLPSSQKHFKPLDAPRETLLEQMNRCAAVAIFDSVAYQKDVGIYADFLCLDIQL